MRNFGCDHQLHSRIAEIEIKPSLEWVPKSVKQANHHNHPEGLDNKPQHGFLQIGVHGFTVAHLWLAPNESLQKLTDTPSPRQSEEARARPKGIETTLTDLYWGDLIMGIPALITLRVLGIGKTFKRFKKGF